MAKPGRPARRPSNGKPSSLTVRFPAEIKILLIDQADATDLSITDYLTSLILRDAGASADTSS